MGDNTSWIKLVFTKDEWEILEAAARSQGHDNFRSFFRSMTSDLEKNLIAKESDTACLGCTKRLNRYEIQPGLIQKLNILSERYNIPMHTLIRYYTTDPILNARLNAYY